jgi:hypothetical protein
MCNLSVRLYGTRKNKVIGVNGRIILKWIEEKYGWRV